MKFLKFWITYILFILILSFMSCDNNDFSGLDWKKNIPNECTFGEHVTRIFGETQKDSETKDFTFLKWASEPCFSALKSLRCQIEAYGLDDQRNPVPIDINNIKRHQAYLTCLSRK